MAIMVSVPTPAMATNMAPPMPIAPGSIQPSGSVISTLTPILEWTAVEGAVAYELGLRAWPPSGPLILDLYNLSETSYQVPEGLLEPGVPYRWNVRALNATQASMFSERLYFSAFYAAGAAQDQGARISNPTKISDSDTINSVFFITLATYAVGTAALLWLLLWRRELLRKRFQDRAMDALDVGGIDCLEDFEHIYLGVGGGKKSGSDGLSSNLRNLLVKTIEKQASSREQVDKTRLDLHRKKIQEILRQMEASAPYDDLPDMERSFLQDLDAYVRSDNKKEALRKIAEITNIFAVRSADENRAVRINRLSVPIAVTGIILTIIFGLASMIRF